MKRALFSETDLDEFKKSSACLEIMSFLNSCVESIKGKTISSVSIRDNNMPVGLVSYVEFVKKLYNIIDEYPPLKQPMRFGNKAFKQFHQRLCVESLAFTKSLLSSHLTSGENVPHNSNDTVEIRLSDSTIDELSLELSNYINGSFGNEIRIDYGTGHELNMFLFYLSIYKLKIIKYEDLEALILIGFSSYIRVMRRLQTEYMLEPAGSHGVWGLDDYHCLTFLFGAAQLCGNTEILPSSVNSMEVLKENKNDYIYLESIYFIRTIKSSAPFSETSPMLFDISGMSDWIRVTATLIRIFQGEVLFKLPSIQHILFGTLLKCSWQPTEDHSNAYIVNHDVNTIHNSKLSCSFVLRPGQGQSIGSSSIMKPSVGR